VGVVAEYPDIGIVEIARPVGVVCAVTPSTNPGATPANKIINANAAHALMLYMKQNGISADMLQQAGQHLDGVKEVDPHYARLKELMPMYDDLAKSD